jgi:hypothetical protein
MTSLEIVFPYEGCIGERESRAAAAIRDVYGIWGLRFNEKERSITVDYDASRLTPANIAFLLRNAGVRVATRSKAA